MGLRKEVVLAVRGGGAAVPRPAGGASPSVRGCYACGDRGHVQQFCPRFRKRMVGGGIVGRCWGWGSVGHRSVDRPGRSLPVVGPNEPLPSRDVGGGSKRASRPLAGALAGRGGVLRGGGLLGYAGVARGLVGAAPMGAN